MDKRKNYDSKQGHDLSEREARIVFWCMVGVAFLLLLSISGCEEFIQDTTSSAVTKVPHYNDNCTGIDYIKGSDGKIYAEDIPPFGVGEFTVRRPPLNQGDKVILVAVSYDPPRGCEDFGRDDMTVRFRDGEVDTDDWTIRLRPD